MKKNLFLTLVIMLVSTMSMMAEAPSAGYYYLYNTETGKWLSRGGQYARRAMIDNYGTAFSVEIPSAGVYQFKALENNKYFVGAPDEGGTNYLDVTGDTGDSFALTETTDGTFIIQKQSGTTYYKNYYIGVNYDVRIHMQSAKASAYHWQFYTPEEHNKMIEQAHLADHISVVAKEKKTITTEEEFNDYLASCLSVDMTDNVTNAALTANNNGWNYSDDCNIGISWSNNIASGAHTKLTQTVSNLRSGIYKVTLQSYFRGMSDAASMISYANQNIAFCDAYLQANDYVTEIKDWTSIRTTTTAPASRSDLSNFSAEKFTNSVYTWVGSDGQMTITFASPVVASAFYFNNVTLTYYTAKSEKEEALATATAIKGKKMDSTLNSQLLSAIDALTNATDDEVESATKTLNTLVDQCYESIKNYEALEVLLDEYSEKCYLLDNAGKAAFMNNADVTAIKTAYDNGNVDFTTTSRILKDAYDAAQAVQKAQNIENTIARKFIDEVEYTRESATQMNDYYTVTTTYRKDRPYGVTIAWDAAMTAQTLTYSERSDFSKSTSVTVAASVGEYVVYNLMPDKTYYYKVTTGTTTIKEGKFLVEGPLRMMYVTSMSNVRDLGGWMTQSGKKIQYGKIYRGCEMNVGTIISEEGIKVMRDELGIQAELDIRQDSQIGGITSSPLGEDIAYRHSNQVDGYTTYLKSDAALWGANLKFIIENLKLGRPVYFHCQIGADRTGTMAFLIEGLLGVSISDLYKDYELTSFSGLNTPRFKENINDMINYVYTFSGTTLEDKFRTLVKSTMGVTDEDVDELRTLMFGEYSEAELFSNIINYAKTLSQSPMNAAKYVVFSEAISKAEQVSANADEDTIVAAREALADAITNALVSIDEYKATNKAMTTYAAKAYNLDDDGLNVYNVESIQAAYDNRTLDEDKSEAVRLAYVAAVKAQTTPGTDMTEIINDWTKAASWTKTVNNGTLQYNTWSGTASGYSTPYLELWRAMDSGVLTDNCVYQTITGLHSGIYEVSMNTAVNDEKESLPPVGVYLFANDSIESVCSGTVGGFNGFNGIHKVQTVVGKTGTLKFGIKVEDTNCNWINLKDVTLKYVGAYKEEITEDVNGDGNVDSQDVLKIYDYMKTSTGSVTSNTLEDVNHDGKVDSQDVLKIYDYMKAH